MPGYHSFEVYEGDTVELVIDVSNPDGTPADLTGATARWQAAKTPEGPPTITKVVALAGGSEVRISLSSADTAQPPGDYYHELQIEDAGGSKFTALAGKLRILPALVN